MKKILILTSIGGGGQVTVNKSLTQSLKHEYNVKSIFYFSHVLNCVDLIAILSFGYCSGEDFYNYVQKKRFFRLMQACYLLSRWYYHLLSPLLIKKTTAYLKQERPDLVISIVPIVNNIIAESCKKLDIPLLIIPPDLDVGFYTQDLRGPHSKKLFIALPFDNLMSRKSLTSANIPEDQIFTIAFPLRHDFFEKKDIKSIKQEYEITDNCPVILLMMGAQGNHGSYTFTKEIIQLKEPIHLFVCIGKNETVKKALKTIDFPAHIAPHIIGYTDRISDLMAVADIMISKTGIVSVMEGLYSDVPIIADQTEFVLSWELFHQHFLEKYHCGFILKDLQQLAPLVSKLLNNKKLLTEVKENINKLLINQKSESINQLIQKIID